jgi:ornithine carbamoyltransferase
MRHLTTLAELRPAEIEHIFAIAEDLKTKFQAGRRDPLLPGRMMALVFEKPSLRTRVSFETAMVHLGGGSIFLGQDARLGKREDLGDFIRVLSQYADVIVARVFEHAVVERFAAEATCVVINGLSDEAHPCQALADVFTLREHIGRVHGSTIAFCGDGNNVAKSLVWICAKLGMKFRLAAPDCYQLPQSFLDSVLSEHPEADLQQTSDCEAAVKDATVVYTDVWASMGQEAEAAEKNAKLKAYQVNAALMAMAPKDALFMHCLPAHRGEEVTDEVIDGPQSIVIEQAANRMHAQKGLLAWLLASQADR